MITHPEKVLFPEDGITKGEVAAYYEMIAPLAVPHMRARPVTMERFPRGIGEKGFMQKNVVKGFPEWLERVEVLENCVLQQLLGSGLVDVALAMDIEALQRVRVEGVNPLGEDLDGVLVGCLDVIDGLPLRGCPGALRLGRDVPLQTELDVRRCQLLAIRPGGALAQGEGPELPVGAHGELLGQPRQQIALRVVAQQRLVHKIERHAVQGGDRIE